MKPAIKICGVRDIETYKLLLALKVEWLGLVFYPKSPRYITSDQIKLFPKNAEYTKRVGLFVKPKIEDIETVLNQIPLDILQIYDSLENVTSLRNYFKLPTWAAIGVHTKADLPMQCSLEGLVVEAPTFEGDAQPGGNGRSFNWSLTTQWKAPVPWLLAGGLNPVNVVDALRCSRAKAVDVSSGVESSRGVKDHNKIKHFVNAVRQYDIVSAF